MRTPQRIQFSVVAVAAILAGCFAFTAPARAQQYSNKDFLSDTEAEKIRNADTPADRIKLFVSFAADRIKKIQYELAHPGDSLHRSDRMNALINGYAGCLDEAADLIELGADKQQEIRSGIKDMQKNAPEFLTYLKQVEAKPPADLANYKDNLDDAIESTQDALKSANDASKEIAPPPVRRRPQ